MLFYQYYCQLLLEDPAFALIEQQAHISLSYPTDRINLDTHCEVSMAPTY